MLSEEIELRVRLSRFEAEAFAQFLKRVDPDDLARRAGDDREARLMWDAGCQIKQALAHLGFAPR